LGYLAINDDGQDGHVFFYRRAAEYLDISCFAAGHLYTLQALILFGGYYLHYLNKPNMASAVMGAAHRMALAMGLHRLPQTDSLASEEHRAMESRTRTWWCLFCLDTWAGTTLGRPIAGAWRPAHMSNPLAHQRADSVSSNGRQKHSELTKARTTMPS
jgi:Fungal specific transcription factor domain